MHDRSNRNVLMILVIALLLVVASVAAHSRSTTNGRLPQPYATPSAMNLPNVIGWPHKETPRAPNGFMVDALVTDIESPRWLYVLPNGDLLVAQSRTANTAAGSLGTSPNQITLLRDANGLKRDRSLLLR